jgi:hypothetical protein
LNKKVSDIKIMDAWHATWAWLKRAFVHDAEAFKNIYFNGL